MGKKHTPKHLKEKPKKDGSSKNFPDTDISPAEKLYDDNTLVISALKGKVFLPYKKAELEKILGECKNKYSSIQDIINSNYTLPLDMFKNAPIARFREAFKLMYYKQKEPLKDALNLGFELMLNYNLHPAIVSACKSIDELDIYLDYLESGEPQKFDCFNIIFEFPPMVIKKTNI